MNKNTVRTNEDYSTVLGARSEKRLTAADHLKALIDDLTETGCTVTTKRSSRESVIWAICLLR